MKSNKTGQEFIFGIEPELPKTKREPGQVIESDVDFTEREAKGKILTVRGTNGSGKSYIARAIKESYDTCESVFQGLGSRPYYYILSHPGRNDLALLGSYETDCGGCDGMPNVAVVYELVKRHYAAGRDVFYEGLLHSADIKHSSAMALPMTIVFLNTPIEKCLESINMRRAAKGNPEPVNPKNPVAKYGCVLRAIERAPQELPNAEFFVLDRNAALEKCFEVLGIKQ